MDEMIAAHVAQLNYKLPDALRRKLLQQASQWFAGKEQPPRSQVVAEGVLLAAADEQRSPTEAVVLSTSHNEFTLTIQPSVDDSDHGLITLTAAEDKKQNYQGKYLRARNRKEDVLIEGVMHDGIVRKHVSNLSAMLLNTDWYVEIVFKEPDVEE